MKSLLLSGYGIKMNVDGGKLYIRNGNDDGREPEEHIFKPKFIDYDSIVVYGHSGNITLDAIRWLTKQNVQVVFLDWNGKLLTTIEPLRSKQSITRMAQYRAYENPKQRINLAKKFIDAKIRKHMNVLEWLGERYPHINQMTKQYFYDIEQECNELQKASSIKQVMGVEGMFSRRYWNIISTLFDERLEFTGRIYGKTMRPMGAVDPINALFNYGYAILEGICRNAIYRNGMDVYVGFLHEMNPSKTPLVYDLQEPFRWLVDIAVINGLENKVFNKKDFMLTENYNIRLRVSGTNKLMNELNAQFTKRIRYKGRYFEWRTVIVEKAHELSQYLTNRRKTLDFSKPVYKLERIDSDEMRKKILAMPYNEWKKMGYSKGTLHYMKQNAKQNKPFKVYAKGKTKLENISLNI